VLRLIKNNNKCGSVLSFLRFFSAVFFLLFSFVSFADQGRVAIIIDDIGYRYSDAKALELPGNITYSILPHTPYGKKLALKANARNHDVLLHIPMESQKGKRLGPGALTSDMSEEKIYETLAASLNEIPFAIGINNHMGSRLTTLYQPMSWTMSFLKEKQLFFLDSKTSANSQAEQAALDSGVPVNSRHVFLDNQLDDHYIEKQFNELISQAQNNAFAIAIAHPHPETVKNLTRLIPLLAENNITLVPLSELYIKQSLTTVAQYASE